MEGTVGACTMLSAFGNTWCERITSGARQVEEVPTFFPKSFLEKEGRTLLSSPGVTPRPVHPPLPPGPRKRRRSSLLLQA